MPKNIPGKFDRIAYLFSGGGALGAYQVGVFKGLSEAGYEPDWVIGTSIGAINSAIIAGNKPQDRVKKLEGFWELISTKMPQPYDGLNNILLEKWQHFLSSQWTELHGQAGFFRPRAISPWLGVESTLDKLSYYETDELRETLLKFINFDLLNESKVRLSIGAVRVSTGHLVHFDNTKIEIKPEHVMASGALPPGFPAINIDDQFYWDGGVHSNTQLNLLLSQKEPINYLCFMVHLFDSYGTRPTNMDEVLKRQKDITYSSHHKQSIYIYKAVHNLRHAIGVLGSYLPEDVRQDPEIQKLIDLGRSGFIHVVRFHYKGKLSDLSSKDYEFSYPSTIEHISNGTKDVSKILRDPPWKQPPTEGIGLTLSELSDSPVGDDGPFESFENYHVIS